MVTNGLFESRVGDPVVRWCFCGEEAATDFMFALCAWLKVLQLMIDAIIMSLVIAQFKMQAGNIFKCTPVTTI
jgi:hypothetical protein